MKKDITQEEIDVIVEQVFNEPEEVWLEFDCKKCGKKVRGQRHIIKRMNFICPKCNPDWWKCK